MDSVTNVALDTSEVRPARAAAAAPKPGPAPARPRRLLRAGGAALGLVALAGAGFGAYLVFGPEAKTKLAAASFTSPRGKIQFGPLADMPEIRDGVPAIVRSAPANVVERRVAAPAPVPVPATPQSSERDVAAALAPRSAQPLDDPSADAANARAMASTVSLRSGGAPAATRDASTPVRVVATQPVPSATPAAPPVPVVASLEPAASPVPAEAPPMAVRRDPEPVGSIQPAPLRPAAAAPAQPPRAAATETPPLPPVRRVSRAFEAPVQAPPAPRQSSAASRLVAAPSGAPAPVAAQATPQPPEERPEIFGLPLPRFVPTGRQIRDAASSVADAVTSIPDVF